MARSLDLAATPLSVRGGVVLSGKYNVSKRPDAKRDTDDQKRALLLLDQGVRQGGHRRGCAALRSAARPRLARDHEGREVAIGRKLCHHHSSSSRQCRD